MTQRPLRILLWLGALSLSACADLNAAKAAYQAGDLTTAQKNWIDLAARGFPEAQTRLGETAMDNENGPAGPMRGVGFYNKAMAEQYPPAFIALGRLYQSGYGLPKDDKKARNLFNRARVLGDSRAYAALGELEMEEKNFSEAEDDFKKALAAGDALAWRPYGRLHMAENRPDLAEMDFQKAIAMNDIDAYIPLGDAQIALKKFSEAEASYQAAIDRGIARGYVKVGEMRHFGQGGPIDNMQALKFFYQARAQGVRNMNRRIVNLERHLTLDQLAKAKKIEMEITLANNDLSRAPLTLQSQ